MFAFVHACTAFASCLQRSQVFSRLSGPRSFSTRDVGILIEGRIIQIRLWDYTFIIRSFQLCKRWCSIYFRLRSRNLLHINETIFLMLRFFIRLFTAMQRNTTNIIISCTSHNLIPSFPFLSFIWSCCSTLLECLCVMRFDWVSMTHSTKFMCVHDFHTFECKWEGKKRMKFDVLQIVSNILRSAHQNTFRTKYMYVRKKRNLYPCL